MENFHFYLVDTGDWRLIRRFPLLAIYAQLKESTHLTSFDKSSDKVRCWNLSNVLRNSISRALGQSNSQLEEHHDHH